MTVFEIILLICGFVCVVVSFIMGDGNDTSMGEVQIDAQLTDEQKDSIRKQINEVLKEEIDDISEKTEASLDKISNTKILEMNEYAETIMGEISRNHNETVFLYDMLNEKAKEVKSTVKNVNIATKQAEKIKTQNSGKNNEETISKTSGKETSKDNGSVSDEQNTRDVAKERLVELVKKSNEKASRKKSNSQKGTQAEKLNDIVNNNTEKSSDVTKKDVVKSDNKKKEDLPKPRETAKKNEKNQKEVSNEKILKLYESGYSNTQIAKQLNVGVGEVNLVIDLYNNEK